MGEVISVVGGGVIGLAIAREALVRGYDVELVHEERPGAASIAAAGMLAPIAEAEEALSPLLAFGLASLEMYADWIASFSSAERCDLSDNGSLLVALHGDHVAQLRHQQRGRRRLGIDAEWLERDAVLELEPNLSPRVQGALHVPQERAVDPRRLCAELRSTIDARARLVERPSGRIVACSGAWTRAVAMHPVRGQALRLSGEPLLRHVVRTPDVYLVPRRGGGLYVGATVEDQGFDTTPRAGGAFELLRDAFRVVPGIYELAVEAHVVGLRPATRDHLPAIGFVGDELVATGHFRNGVLLAPATAKLAVDILQGAEPNPAFDPRRFEGCV